MEASGRAELSCPWVLRLWLIVQGQLRAVPVWGGRASGLSLTSQHDPSVASNWSKHTDVSSTIHVLGPTYVMMARPT